MGFDLDRLERLAGGLAVLFYVLLFLAFVTAVMGSGGGGLLLLLLGAAAHVGRVGLEDFVERRRALGGAAAPIEDDAGERATGLRLRWLPSEIRLPTQLRLPGQLRLPSQVRLPGGIDLGGIRSRAADLRDEGSLAAARADVRASLAALVAEIKERPARAPRRSVGLPHGGAEDAPSVLAYDDQGLDFDDGTDDFAFVDSRYEDFEDAEPGAGADTGYEFEDFESPVSPSPAPSRGAPSAQERYEARQRARAERGEAEPIAAAVGAAETQAPQRVQRRSPGGRPDPLRTRRPTRSF